MSRLFYLSPHPALDGLDVMLLHDSLGMFWVGLKANLRELPGGTRHHCSTALKTLWQMEYSQSNK